MPIVERPNHFIDTSRKDSIASFSPSGIILEEGSLIKLSKELAHPTMIAETWRGIQEIEGNEGKVARHSEVVAWLSFHLGKQYLFSSDMLHNTLIAALLHDAGQTNRKLVPLVNKTSAFTPQERTLVNMHGEVGHLSLSAKGFPLEITLPALVHHESSSKRERTYAHTDAALISEVITIADGLEAATAPRSERSWRDPMSLRDAYESIVSNREGRYSPEFFDALAIVCAETESLQSRLETDVIWKIANMYPVKV